MHQRIKAYEELPMKKIILVAIIAAGAWWYFVGGRKISEADVTSFYRDYDEIATGQRQPDTLCSMFAEDYHSTATIAVGRQIRTDSMNKPQTCESLRLLYDSWEKLGEKMGGMLQLDSYYTIHSISLASDRKSATVDISSSLDVAGSIMNMRSRSTDTLVRRNGKVLLLRSDAKVSMGSGS